MSESLASAELLRLAVAQLGRGLNLPKVSACELVAREYTRIDAAAALPRPTEIEAIRKDIFHSCQRGGADSLPRELLRKAPLVFWNGENPAASIPGLFETFLQAAGTRKNWLISAVEAWLRDFAPEIQGFTEAGLTLGIKLRQAKHPRLCAWAQADKDWGLFNSAEGPRRLAIGLLGTQQPVDTVLECVGMDSPLRAQGRLFRAAIDALLDALPAALSSPTADESWRRAQPLLQITDNVRDRFGTVSVQRQLRFDGSEGKVARACLKAWVDQRVHPSAPRTAIMSFLIATIGDPRLRPMRWTEAGEEVTRLMRSWLSAETLEAFLSLISNKGDTQQWRYRQAFWRACIKKVPDAEVWVVLGRNLARQAQLVRDLRDTFGHMNSGDQAVLLVRLGNVVFSEWSNVGSLRAWDISHKSCPPMNRKGNYDVGSLKAPCLEFPEYGSYATWRPGGEGNGLAHHSPDRGLWQARAAALLRAKVGITLNPSDYMPR